MADPDTVCKSMQHLFGFNIDEILRISAKSNLNIDLLQNAIIDKLNPPDIVGINYAKILIFDSYRDIRGIILLIRMFGDSISNELNPDMHIYSVDNASNRSKVLEIGNLKFGKDINDRLDPSNLIGAGDIG